MCLERPLHRQRVGRLNRVTRGTALVAARKGTTGPELAACIADGAGRALANDEEQSANDNGAGNRERGGCAGREGVGRRGGPRRSASRA